MNLFAGNIGGEYGESVLVGPGLQSMPSGVRFFLRFRSIMMPG